MGRSQGRPKANTNSQKTNGYDVLIAAINKGQFPLFCVTVLIAILLIRLPQNEVSNIISQLIEAFEQWHMLGWVFWITTILIAWFMLRFQRKSNTGEMTRVTKHKKELQAELMNKKQNSTKD